MSEISLWMNSNGIGGRGRDNLRISHTTSNGWEYTSFRLTGRLQDEAGLEPGDRLDVRFDAATGVGRLQRVKVGGWRLQVIGQRTRCAYLRIARVYCAIFSPWEFPLHVPVSVEEGVVHFELPLPKK